MGIKVPTYEEQVNLDTPVSESGRSPRVVPDAFGGNVGRAVENAGQVAQKVTEHAYKMYQDKQLEQVYDLATKYSTDLQNKLLNSNTKTIKDSTGASVEIPDGILNRKLSQAQGSTVDFDNHAISNQSKYLNLVKTAEAQKYLKRMMDSDYQSLRNQVIRHEATEHNNSIKNTFSSSLTNQAAQASLATDTDSLKTAIGKIKATNSHFSLALGDDEETTIKRENDILQKAVNNSVLATLRNTGSAAQAAALLDSVKENIPEEVYQNSRTKIETGAGEIAKLQRRIAAEGKIANRYVALDNILSGKLDWTNIDDEIKKAGSKDPDLAEALQKVVTYSGDVPIDTKNVPFAEAVKKMLTLDDKQQVSDYLINVLKEAPNGSVSRDRLAILVNLAKKQAEGVDDPVVKSENNNLKNILNYISYSVPALAPFTIMRLLKEVQGATPNKDKLKEKADKLITEEAKAKHSEITHLDGVPNMLYSDDGIDNIYNGPNQLQGEGYNGEQDRESSQEPADY